MTNRTLKAIASLTALIAICGCDTSYQNFPMKPPRNATPQKRKATEAANKSFQAALEGMGEGVQKMGQTIEHQLTPADSK